MNLSCGHRLAAEKRPNPRKVWPDPQMCETCKRKMRVVEIRSATIIAHNLTSPHAPKKYIKALSKTMKKGK